MKNSTLTIGILDLQGDVIEHRHMLEACGARTVSIKTVADLGARENGGHGLEKSRHGKGIDGLVIPGGESTVISKLLKWGGLWEAIQERAQPKSGHPGLPIYGTCAGAILLAKKVKGGQDVPTLGLMDIEVERNSYGRQLESFEGEVELLPAFFDSQSSREDTSLRSCLLAVFIRAPRIKSIGQNVKVLAQYDGDAVLALDGNCLVSTFHPELTDDPTVHCFFLTLCAHARSRPVKNSAHNSIQSSIQHFS